MSVCKTDALAAWRSEQYWCTRKDLNLHAVAAAASEAAASTVSPRVHSSMVPQRRIERRFPPYQSGALPLDDCGQEFSWCWLEDSNLPPLAYEASALPDELSQLWQIDKRVAAPLPEWKRPCRCAEARRRVQIGRSQCQRARRHRRRSHRRTASWCERAHGCACAVGTRGELGCTSVGSAGHLPSCLSGGGGTLRRLFRFQSRVLFGPIEQAGEAPIAARAHGQPTVRSIRPSGGGAERGGDM